MVMILSLSLILSLCIIIGFSLYLCRYLLSAIECFRYITLDSLQIREAEVSKSAFQCVGPRNRRTSQEGKQETRFPGCEEVDT